MMSNKADPALQAHPDYVVMPVDQIWSGAATLPQVKPGWAMGHFFPVGDLRHTSYFEVKEWNAALAQPDWKKHEDIASEYISVTGGKLTVVFGGSDQNVAESTSLDLTAGQAIVIRPGVWRRFHATEEARGLSVRSQRTGDVARVHSLYAAYVDHWKHTDQIRQWLLYNFLMTGSIMGFGVGR